VKAGIVQAKLLLRNPFLAGMTRAFNFPEQIQIYKQVNSNRSGCANFFS